MVGIATEIDYTLFQKGLDGFLRKLRIDSRVVIAKEMGELIKTLVRISPPQDPKKTRASIKKNFSNRFEILNKQTTNFEASEIQTSSSGVKWYAANSRYLFGAAADSDMREASQTTLLHIYYRAKTVQESKRIVVGFKNRNTRQRVAIATRILTTKKQVNDLVARVSAHVGRLKAGWLAAVRDGKIEITGAYKPPGWVTRHANMQLRGRYVDGLKNPDGPSFLVANSAKGISSRYNRFLVQKALDIRGKAMRKNLMLYFGGKKRVADYANQTDRVVMPINFMSNEQIISLNRD
jgi:hypothetical protein